VCVMLASIVLLMLARISPGGPAIFMYMGDGIGDLRSPIMKVSRLP